MPSVPKYTKCQHLGCKNTKSKYNSFCLEHGGRDTYDYQRYNSDAQRTESNAMYNTTQWRKFRVAQLSREPLCASCLADGIVTAAEHLDHVFPWTAIDKQAFYHNVFQSLCASCHSAKTTLEQKGIYRRYGTPNIDYRMSDYKTVVRSNFTPRTHEKLET